MAFPFANLFRRQGKPDQTRALEAASGGYRWAGRTASQSPASSIRAGAHLVGARAADFALNNPHGARMKQVLADNMVGTGIKPKARAESEGLRQRLHRAFDIWTDRADSSGLGDLFALQHRLVTDMVIFGEALAVFEAHPDGAPSLKQLHPDQLDRSKTVTLSESRFVVQGVEFDKNSAAPVAYWLRPSAPGEAAPAGSLRSVSLARLPAGDVIHMFRPLVPGQVRGLSWFAPILLAGHELDQLLDALLVRAKVSALHTGFVYDPAGEGSTYPGTANGDTLDTGMEPGTLLVMPNGKRVEFPNLPDSGDAQGLATTQLRAMAAGIGCTYEQVTGDFSQVNYSSARAAFLEFRRFCEAVQHHVIVHQLCRPVWARFMRWQVLRGTVTAQAFMDPANGLQSAKWLPPSWPWVDPLKDARAAIMEIDANLRSRSEVIAERGYDAEEIDAEISADRRRAQRLGIEAEETGNAA
ncbi:phage portal protein, lambda family [Roseivivax halotolerans]|uniref:Phage portal protein, lambda family n=1 Tax=Roseivivax halotolerans TaxID=93684 RepID=A0A1I6ACU4_9RHOB|nr:phage portal protein [Roseivivax halotolerans]SFQ66564.1 phage portal protein, lambda family [Roseivivax halotolerans]